MSQIPTQFYEDTFMNTFSGIREVALTNCLIHMYYIQYMANILRSKGRYSHKIMDSKCPGTCYMHIYTLCSKYLQSFNKVCAVA